VTILGVHGVGNHGPGSDEDNALRLSAKWTRHLRTNLATYEVAVRVAYYAGHLDPGTMSMSNPDALPQVVQDQIRTWAVQLGAPLDGAQGVVTVPIRQVLDWVARRYGLDHPLVDRLVATFFPEVHIYLADPASPRRHIARKAVADALQRWRPRIVLAHSLGSVVAYEALWTQLDIDIDLLITMGSPLGMPAIVYDRLVPAAFAQSRPPNVRRWVNVADKGDLIAIPKSGLTGLFSVDVDRQDLVIGNLDFHSSSACLKHPLIAEEIVKHLA